MIDFYVYQIKNNLKKWTDVPNLWQDDVKKRLKKDNYTLNKDGTVTAMEVN